MPLQAQVPLSLQPDFECLSRQQKEMIVTCFEQLDNCHGALEEVPLIQDHSLTVVVGIAALITGAIISSQVR